MKLPPRETTAESDLTIPFQQSASKSSADQDPFFPLLMLRFRKPAEDSATLQVSILLGLPFAVLSCASAALLRDDSHL